ncbi:MAG: hypothetical protein GEU26_17890 [Nitrososphaeraceae archaeon]|nr:hypothetical protein [Nitrososphaeraceae archaeon]
MPNGSARSICHKDILEIVYDNPPLYRNQVNQTRIGYEAGLIHPQAVKYLRALVNRGLLVLTDFKPFSHYEITEKGKMAMSSIIWRVRR